jgi:hypothetical protein
MTTTEFLDLGVPGSPERTPAHRRWGSAAATVLTAGAAALLTYLALHNPPGVMAQGGDDYAVEFTNGPWDTLGLLLVVPIFLIGFRSVWSGLAAAAACGLAQFVLAGVTVERYVASGWSDGLEGLAYLAALLVSGLFVGAALLGFGLGRRRRRRRAA